MNTSGILTRTHQWSSRLRVRARRIGRASIDLLFPPHCTFCGVALARCSTDALLCCTCKSGLTPRLDQVCQRCCASLPNHFIADKDCPHCRGRRFHFESVTSIGNYREQLREAVLRLKLSVNEPLMWSMGRLLADRIRRTVSDFEARTLVSVPIHWTRRFSRGINQSEILTASIAHALRIPAEDRLLVCRRKTKKQGTLGAAERTRNVKGAFAICSGFDVSGGRILLVDDVMTTGATASEVAKVCKKGGAASVKVAVVARATGV